MYPRRRHSGDGVGRNEDRNVFESVLLLDGYAGTSKLLPVSKSKVIYILYPIREDRVSLSVPLL